MKKIISIILAFIFLIQVMVFIPSCFIKSDYVGEYVIKKLLNKNYMIERLYGEKQEEINGKTMLTVDDFIELFDIDFYIILHYDLDGVD